MCCGVGGWSVAARQVVCAICKFCAIKLAGLFVKREMRHEWSVAARQVACVLDESTAVHSLCFSL
jgi:hypothetical protein